MTLLFHKPGRAAIAFTLMKLVYMRYNNKRLYFMPIYDSASIYIIAWLCWYLDNVASYIAGTARRAERDVKFHKTCSILSTFYRVTLQQSVYLLSCCQCIRVNVSYIDIDVLWPEGRDMNKGEVLARRPAIVSGLFYQLLDHRDSSADHIQSLPNGILVALGLYPMHTALPTVGHVSGHKPPYDGLNC